MAAEYADCFYCGGAVKEQNVTREIRWEGQLIIFENVPTGVCTQCGEKVLKPQVAKSIDATIEAKKKPSKMLEVPVYEYGTVVA